MWVRVRVRVRFALAQPVELREHQAKRRDHGRDEAHLVTRSGEIVARWWRWKQAKAGEVGDWA